MHRAHVLALLFLAGTAAHAPAQPPAAPPAAPQALQARSPLGPFVSGEIARIALMDIRGLKDPRPTDYQVTLGLLGLAQSLAPADEALARRRAEAAWQAGDADALAAATSDIIRLDPKDTVATLRYLTTRIGAMQTADERLAAYDRAVAAQSLDASIRSRMALDAALLLKERGDDAGFVQRLKQATQLDSTNKEAALLAFTYFTQRVTDPMGRLELASNLLLADPLDVKSHELLRAEFAALNAWRAAARFHRVATGIHQASGLQDETPLHITDAALKWRVDGVRALLDSINNTLAVQRQHWKELADRPGGSFIKGPEDVRLGEPFEEMRLAAAIASQRPNDIQASLTDMTANLQRRIELLRDVTRRPADMTAEQAADALTTAASSQALWQCLASVLAPAQPAPAEGAQPPAPAAPYTIPVEASSPLVSGWAALRDKNYEAAKTNFAQAGDSLWAQLGRAMLLYKTVSNGESARALSDVSSAAPLTALGSLAATLAAEQQLKDGGGRPVTDAKPFEDFATSIPPWIDDMAKRPWGFQAMRVEPVTPVAGNLQPIKLRVRLKNLSPIPLGVGSSRTINTRLLFVPSMANNAGAALMLEPEVIEIDRRLRLMPGEELVCEVWPEVGMVGFAVQQNSHFPSRIRWRVIQGFEVTGPSQRRPGLGCVESQIDAGVLHESLPEVRMKGDDLVNAIATAPEQSLPALFVAARIRLLIGADPALDRLVDAIARRYPSLSPEARMLAIAALPSTFRVPSMKELDRVVALDKDAQVLTLASVTRITSATDPILAAALGTNDPTATRVANAMKARFDRNLQPQDTAPNIAPAVPPDQMPKPQPPASSPPPNGPATTNPAPTPR
ncbi:MAG TPA: hypothetical protein VD997_10045 [Phycisphaerales bacterium]|nr:hypothetical protein [Phycisphaerales bacterium]